MGNINTTVEEIQHDFITHQNKKQRITRNLQAEHNRYEQKSRKNAENRTMDPKNDFRTFAGAD